MSNNRPEWDNQFRETVEERNSRLRKKRLKTMKHFIRLEYDDEKDHFLVEGSNESHKGQYHVTGYKASQILHLFEQELMWNVETHKRIERHDR